MSEAQTVERVILPRRVMPAASVHDPGFGRSRSPLSVIHVCEILPGGVASYLDEILPYQAARYGRENVVLVAPSDHAPFLRSAETISFVGYARSGRNLASISSLAAALRREIEARQPQVLHLHSSFAGAIGRLVAAGTAFDGRLVYCAHGWATDPGRSSRMRRVIQLVERVLFDASDAIVNISPHEQAFLPADWRSSPKLHLIQSGIANIPGLPPLSPRGGGEPWRLLFVGRTDRQKGFDLLMQEMKTLGPAAHLTAIGGSFSESAPTVDLPNVDMLGWLPRDAIAGHMAGADFVVMPSRWEGMPIVALEAMRAGRPVIGADRGAFPHIIDHGRTGLLIDIDRPGFLERALSGVSRQEAREMSLRAREAFEQRFTSAEMNRRLIDLYEQLCNAPAHRAHAPPVMATARLQRAA